MIEKKQTLTKLRINDQLDSRRKHALLADKCLKPVSRSLGNGVSQVIRSGILIGSVFIISACSSGYQVLFEPAALVGAPDRFSDVSDERERLESFLKGDVIGNYIDHPNPEQYRNQVVTARLYLTDLEYQEFIQALHANRVSRNIVLESLARISHPG